MTEMTHEEFCKVKSVGQSVALTFEEWRRGTTFAQEGIERTIAELSWDAGVKAEREACARLVNEALNGTNDRGFAVAQMIRARGEGG